MADRPLHPISGLQDAVDGRLGAAERASVERHVAECAECRRELEALKLVKQKIGASARTSIDAPRSLEGDIRRALDEEDKRAPAPEARFRGPFNAEDQRAPTSQEAAAKTRTPGWIGWVAAAAVVVVALGWLVLGPGAQSIPSEVAADFRAYVTGDLGFDLTTAEPAALEARLRASGLPFETRVFDFAMMNYRLTGGGVHHVHDGPSALFAYEGTGALRMLCQMYEGRVADLPPPAARHVNDGIEFLVYQEGAVTLVFWQEPNGVVCVLAANGNADAAVKLAFAKARRS